MVSGPSAPRRSDGSHRGCRGRLSHPGSKRVSRTRGCRSRPLAGRRRRRHRRRGRRTCRHCGRSVVGGESVSWNLVVGQQEAVRRLQAAVTAPVHAYLFVGPGGAGKRRAATVFAGELLAAADPDNAERHRRLAVDESHADVHVLDPVGNNLRRDEEAEPLIVQASRSPVEGKRKVLIVNRFHTATAAAAASLLKTIEEPPATSIFVLLAEDVPPEHITIESRCTRVDFPPIAEEAIADALVAEGLASPEQAPIIAAAASGSEAQVARISKPVIVVSCGNSAPRNSASGSPHSPLGIAKRLSQATIAAVCSTVSMRCVRPRTPWCATPTRRWRSKLCC
ncbi:MAG: hypothetical protein EBY44_01235 [Actinobacteria bacterium]|nr:hypothetical protein [Actinomycetota bacterium]